MKMSKQYHFVVVYSENENRWSIEWDTTLYQLEEKQGTIFDETTQEWSQGFREDIYEAKGELLSDILSQYNSILGAH
jgi:hypothetical protein